MEEKIKGSGEEYHIMGLLSQQREKKCKKYPMYMFIFSKGKTHSCQTLGRVTGEMYLEVLFCIRQLKH